MIVRPTQQPRPAPGRFFVSIGFALALLTTTVSAQQPGQQRTPVDTLAARRDTTAVRRDTTALAVPTALAPPDSTAPVPDSMRPIRRVPQLAYDTIGSWRAGTWVWDRDSLTTVGYVTVGELLERIPGVITVREGYYGQPEASSALGTTAGRTEVLVDGFVLDPLRAGTYDWSRLELAQVRRIIVQRRLDVLHVEIQTLEPKDARPFAAIEAAVTEPNSKLFRGIFIAPSVLHGPLAFAVDHLDTDGAHRSEAANTFSGWAKYAFVFRNNALQFEFRKASIERSGQLGSFEPVIAPGKGDRTDWVIRARTQPIKNFTGELFFGHSSVNDSLTITTVSDSLVGERTAEDTQMGARASLGGIWGSAQAAVRLRDNEFLPSVQADISGYVSPIPLVSISGGATYADWREAGTGVSYDARAVVSPIPMVSILAETSAGKRGVSLFGDSARATALTDRTGLRFGAGLDWRRLHLNGALLKVKTDSVPSFLLPFDSLTTMYPGGDLSGFEVSGSIPLYFKPLSLEGWYQKWQSGTSWIYVPDQTIRGALTFHTVPLPSGNLEIIARLIGRRRGEMQIPLLDGSLTTVPSMDFLDFSLQIRIMALKVFFRWEDLTHTNDAFDIPGRIIPGPRLFYGVRWEFFN